MPQSTGVIAVDPANGRVTEYVPPRVTQVTTGNSNVVIGAQQTIAVGADLPAGTWQVISGGPLQALTTDCVVAPVTITPAT